MAMDALFWSRPAAVAEIAVPTMTALLESVTLMLVSTGLGVVGPELPPPPPHETRTPREAARSTRVRRARAMACLAVEWKITTTSNRV
jgi:hypothetical protein